MNDEEGHLIAGDDGQTAPSSGGASTSVESFSNFTDGAFTWAWSTWEQVQAADINANGDPVLEAWLNLVDNPSALLASEWSVTGDVQLVQNGNYTVPQLTQVPDPTSIGQFLELDANAKSIGFDMSVLSANSGDQLQVLFNDNVLGSFQPFDPFREWLLYRPSFRVCVSER